MEERLKKVREKQISNNYQNIDPLPTLENTEKIDDDNDDEEEMDDSISLSSSQKDDDTNSNVEGFKFRKKFTARKMKNTFTNPNNYVRAGLALSTGGMSELPTVIKATRKAIEKAIKAMKKKKKKKKKRVKPPTTNENLQYTAIISTVATILLGIVIIKYPDVFSNSFVTLVLFFGFYFLIIFSSLEGIKTGVQDCKIKTVRWRTFESFKGWGNVFNVILQSPFCTINKMSTGIFIDHFTYTNNTEKEKKLDTLWIQQSIYEIVSIPIAFFMAKIMKALPIEEQSYNNQEGGVFFDNSARVDSQGPSNTSNNKKTETETETNNKNQNESSNDIKDFIWEVFLKFVQFPASLFYYFMNEIVYKTGQKLNGKEDVQFIFFFLVAWISLYKLFPKFLKLLTDGFNFKPNKYITYIIIITFIILCFRKVTSQFMNNGNDDGKNTAQMLLVSSPLAFGLIILLNLIFVIMMAPLVQILFIVFIIKYFLDLFQKYQLSNDKFTTTFLNLKETPNGLFYLFCIFFVWKLIELMAVHYGDDKIKMKLHGIAQPGLFGLFATMTIVALIILGVLFKQSSKTEQTDNGNGVQDIFNTVNTCQGDSIP